MIIRIFAVSVPTKSLNDAQMRGAFFIYTFYCAQNMLMKRLPHFTKHHKTETDLVALLESRGLIISDEAKAVRYLEGIGYYRLSAYMYPFLKAPKESHQHKEETTFLQVLNLYRFDKKLNILLLNEIEKVEIAIRRAITNIPMQMTGDIYWLTNPQKVYFTICIIKYFLDIISPDKDMSEKMHTLFSKYPEIDPVALGFPNGWESEPLWT